ncbi:hypothetical protein EWM64_g6817 [Hericium alpestre]|uniref:Uncharacterized protein n=1 Tax=Hericium alpestre TaxID=135208 RepID=A0A4Y9ZQL8_9AGAM|nr:hypothetical protein EWM64_g6817 [Hericium alpestre]
MLLAIVGHVSAMAAQERAHQDRSMRDNDGHSSLDKDEKAVLVNFLESERQVKTTGVVRRPLVAMHDIQTMLKGVHDALDSLNQHSGLEFFFFGTRSLPSSMAVPITFARKDALMFMSHILHVHPTEVANCFEAYCLNKASVTGVIAYECPVHGIDKKGATKAMIQCELHRQLGLSGLRLEYS